MKAKHYIGITGAVTTQEVSEISEQFELNSYTMNSEHVPMLGFLVSYKTLHGQPTENRRYPKINELSSLIAACGNKAMPMIHYNSREYDSLASQIAEIFAILYTSGKCRTVQLNISWPKVEQVALIKDIFPEMLIVLQLSHTAMEDKNPQEIADRVNSYGSAINYVLIDPSGGRGLELNIEHSLNTYHKISARNSNLTVGFAGGFTGENVEQRVKELIGRIGTNDFCIDAESGLRDKLSDRYGDDLLNLDKVGRYLESSRKILK